jgi:hypothetical protein
VGAEDFHHVVGGAELNDPASQAYQLIVINDAIPITVNLK